jgi:SMODS-associating 2TM, beta-strand rich effector domain
MKSRVRLTVYIVSGVWSLALFAAGIQLPGLWSKILGALPAIIVAGFALFDTWLWQVGVIRRITRRPLLAGTWKGSLVSLRDKDGQEVEHEPLSVALVVTQSFLEVSVELLSKESRSQSINSLLETLPGNSFKLYYNYTNEPGLRVRDRSPRHAGSTSVMIAGLDPASLTGEYWTDRRSRGTFEVDRVSKKRAGSWKEAQELDR